MVAGFNRRFKFIDDADYSQKKPWQPSQSYKIVALDGTGDYDTIQGALNDIPSYGGTIYIKAGEYFEQDLIIPYSNVTIMGVGSGTPFLTMTGTGASDFFKATALSQIKIANIRMIGNTNVNSKCINFNGCVNSIVNNCIMQVFNGTNINLTNSCLNINISNNRIIEGAIGVDLSDTCSAINITGNIVSECTTTMINVSNSNNINIHSNIQYGSATDGVTIDATSDNVSVMNNIFSQDTGFLGTIINNSGTNTQIGHNITT